jgi:hypothetical protein
MATKKKSLGRVRIECSPRNMRNHAATNRLYVVVEYLRELTIDACNFLWEAIATEEIKPGKHYRGHITVFRICDKGRISEKKDNLLYVMVTMRGEVCVSPISLAALRKVYKTPPNKRKDWWSYQNKTGIALPRSKYRR